MIPPELSFTGNSHDVNFQRPFPKARIMHAFLPSEAEVYVRQAEKAVRCQPHLMHRELRLNCDSGRLELCGDVSSFYEKQMAQEALRQFDRHVEIDNRLNVAW